MRDAANLAYQLNQQGNRVLVFHDEETHRHHQAFDWGQNTAFEVLPPLDKASAARIDTIKQKAQDCDAFIVESWPAGLSVYSNEMKTILPWLKDKGVNRYVLARDFPSGDRPEDEQLIQLYNNLYDKILWRSDKNLTRPYSAIKGGESINNITATGIWSPEFHAAPDAHKNGHVLVTLGGTHKDATENLVRGVFKSWPFSALNKRKLILLIPGGEQSLTYRMVMQQFQDIIQKYNIEIITHPIPEAEYNRDYLSKSALYIGHGGSDLFKVVSAGIPAVSYPLLTRYPSEETAEQFLRAKALKDFITIVREPDTASPMLFAQIIDETFQRPLPPVPFAFNGEKKAASIITEDITQIKSTDDPIVSFEPQHIREMETALDLRKINNVKAIPGGKSESTFLLDTDIGKLVATIYSTPSDNLYGMSSERAKHAPIFAHHVAANMVAVRDRKQNPVPSAVLTPLRWNHQEPYGTLMFKDGKERVVSIVPYVQGYSYARGDISVEDCYQAGQALAAFHKSSQEFEHADNMPNVNSISEKLKVLRSLAADESAQAVLNTGHTADGEKPLMERMLEAGDRVGKFWREHASSFPEGMVHNDFTPYNCLRSGDTGKMIVIDFGEASFDKQALDIAIGVQNWCMTQKKPDIQKTKAFLKGYSQVNNISPQVSNHLLELTAVAAFRFAVILAELKTKINADVSSPKQLMDQYDSWMALAGRRVNVLPENMRVRGR